MEATAAKAFRCAFGLGLGALSLSLAIAEPPAETAAESQPLPPIEVTGQQSPYDAQRAKLERALPCMGDCDTPANPVDQILMSVLGFVILPAAPPDSSRVTPVALRQPTKARLEDKLP